jgi:hypothetical protein
LSIGAATLVKHTRLSCSAGALGVQQLSLGKNEQQKE